MVPRKGAYVATFSMKDVVEVFEIRGALEGLAAALAAERITENWGVTATVGKVVGTNWPC